LSDEPAEKEATNVELFTPSRIIAMMDDAASSANKGHRLGLAAVDFVLFMMFAGVLRTMYKRVGHE
jgi:hypothetical protein